MVVVVGAVVVEQIMHKAVTCVDKKSGRRETQMYWRLILRTDASLTQRL